MFIFLISILLGFGMEILPRVLCDTGSSDLQGTKMDSAIYQLQQLINQESMLRLTLDKQIQETRSAMHKMHLKLDTLEKVCQKQLPQRVTSMRSALNTVEMKIHNITEFLDVDDMVPGKRNLNMGEIERRINRTYDALQLRTMQEMAALDNRVSFFANILNTTIFRANQTIGQRPAILFSASLSTGFTTGSSDEVIVFDNVLTNEGGSYNASSGVFTCPHDGIYLLTYGFLSAHASRIHVKLAINDNDVMWAVTPENQAYNSAARSYFFRLARGDEVKVRVNESGARFYDARNGRYCTFSGMFVSD